MKCSRILLILSIFYSVGVLKAQSIDTLDHIPNDRFNGGQSQFYTLLNSAIGYPRSSLSKATVGTSVVAVNVTAQGVITNVSILVSLDEEIDYELENAIYTTSQNWLEVEDQNDLVFVVPVTFIVGDITLSRSLIPDRLCPEVIIKGISSGKNKFKEDSFYSQKYNKEFNKGNLSKALPYLDELIRRNPFDAQQLHHRIRLRILLGSPTLACKDVLFLNWILEQNAQDDVVCE